MGASYYVEYRLYPKSTPKCKDALRNYLKSAQMNSDGETLEELIKTVLLANGEYSNYEMCDEYHYRNSFDANYMYEIILTGAFSAMSPYLMDHSAVYIEPDDYYYLITVKDGRCINSRNARVRNLCKKDLSDVEQMDEMSGFNVFEFLKDNVDDGYDEVDNCFGIFYEDELVGYCSSGDACGAIGIQVKSNDVLLSDVYIKKEWRNMCFASKLIKEVTDNLDDDCYLTFLHDGLEKFYNKLGFEKITNTDNIMVKYHD